jgi:hypothetical protein
MRAGGGSGSSGDNIECVGEYGEMRSFHVGTLQRHYKKISDSVEEISDQKGRKSLPSVGNFNCSVICSMYIVSEKWHHYLWELP